MFGANQWTSCGSSQYVLDYLEQLQAENPKFFYRIQTDYGHPNGNIFWADPTCGMNFACFGDTVTFDTVRITDEYNVPFVSFTGINHHGQPVLFGCALVPDESECSYVWIFQSWLEAMEGRFPLSITTEPNHLVHLAVSQVLPGTRHRYSTESIFHEAREKLFNLYRSHTDFETEFRTCVTQTETVTAFESSWQSLLQRYHVLDNVFLRFLYDIRHMWVPAFTQNTFHGEVSKPGDRSGVDSFFAGHVTSSTTLKTLMNHYEKAMEFWREKEVAADEETRNIMPVLKTPSPMEKQAAGIYTRRIFLKFQEELVETLANSAKQIESSGPVLRYRVAKFGAEDQKAHTVCFNPPEPRATCSCQMFEYSGIVCQHVLAVFRARNVLTLPSYYILRRWSRNAKNTSSPEDPGPAFSNSCRQLSVVSLNELREEAMKYAAEGSKSVKSYVVAMGALKEATKRVVDAGRQDFGAAHGASQLTYGDAEKELKKEKIRRLTEELETKNLLCEAYKSNLLAVLKGMEEQKMKLSSKVQSALLSLGT